MRLLNVNIQRHVDRSRLVGELLFNDPVGRRELYIEVAREHETALDTSGTAFVIAALLPCMKLGEDLHAGVPHDEHLLRNLDELMRVYHMWYPDRLKPIGVHLSGRAMETGNTPPTGLGAFFSGGVDSMQLVSRLLATPAYNNRPVTLIPVHYDGARLSSAKTYDRVATTAQHIAIKIGGSVIPVTTNLVTALYRETVRWTEEGYGSAMAFVSHALSRHLSTSCIAASITYWEYWPNASSAFTDPLWSSSSLSLHTIGSELDRVGKLEEIKRNGHARWLDMAHVCNGLEPGKVPNCGVCEKCRRTIIAMEAAGVLEEARAAFPERATRDLCAVAKGITCKDTWMVDWYAHFALALRRRGETDLARIVEHRVKHYRPSLLKRLWHAASQTPAPQHSPQAQNAAL
ncbi:MAG: hypothetical protein GC164_07975 [Phycisphaera sp.]|nr:hypothetical protein [Phycisphaera sp.]